VHLARLRLRDFRNYARLDVDFSPGVHLLLGRNAQGKTNLLEAVYLLATLRSFRGVGSAPMVRQGRKGYFVGATAVGPSPHAIALYWSATERRLTLDGQPVRRMTDYWGVLRAVVFCTEDLQLVKGPSSRRRRFLDLLLAQTHSTYLALLQTYLQAVRSRNALLKQRIPDDQALDAFTHQLVRDGATLMQLRHQIVPVLAPLIRSAYGRVARDAEDLRMEYLPSVKGDLAVALAQNRDRDRAQRTTLLGPHRDDLGFWLDGRAAGPYASEGQKRTLAIALKMAQAEYLTNLHGTPPILLIDDVMGELDLARRSGFLPLLDRSRESGGQVFMTCTEEAWPRELGRRLLRWRVDNGSLAPCAESADDGAASTDERAGADQASDRSTRTPSGGNVSSAENGC